MIKVLQLKNMKFWFVRVTEASASKMVSSVKEMILQLLFIDYAIFRYRAYFYNLLTILYTMT